MKNLIRSTTPIFEKLNNAQHSYIEILIFLNMLRKVLKATDDSEPATNAFIYALENTPEGAEMFIVTATPEV